MCSQVNQIPFLFPRGLLSFKEFLYLSVALAISSGVILIKRGKGVDKYRDKQRHS